MRPQLPPEASNPVDRISVATWRRILTCLEYAMDHPRGDGVTILNQSGGTLRALSGPSGGDGVAAVASTGYNGYFKVINATVDDGVFQVRVVNGADPESLICGHTDLGEVPAVTLTPTESDRVVRLEAKWDSAAGKYVQTLKCVSKTNDGVPSFILADLSFGKKSVSQVWENGTVLWRESYWV